MNKKVFPLLVCFSMVSSMLSMPVYAQNTANTHGVEYYVDSVNGDDANSGTSESRAFQSLAKVNEIELKPGDSVLLKKGSEFDGQLKPKGSGDKDNPIQITSYGEGNQKPVINGKGVVYPNAVNNTSSAVLIENMNHVVVSDLEITNDDVFNETSDKNDKNNMKGNNQRRIGVHITINEDASTFDKNQRAWGDITIKDCYIHDVDGDEQRSANKINGGIGVEVFFRNANQVYPYFDGVTLDSNTIEQVDRTGIKGIRLTELSLDDTSGGDQERYNAIRAAEDKNQAGRNFVVKNNILRDIGGDGILIDSTKRAVVERNVLYDHTKRSQLANAGIWCWNALDTLFQYNESYGGPSYNQDGCSYDCDYNCAGTIFQYNYSHDTPMGFMLLMGGNEMDIVRYNISQNDGTAWRHFSNQSTTKSYIYNNVFYYDGAKWDWSLGNKNEDLRNNYEFYNNVFYNYNDTTPTQWGSKMDWSKAVFGSNVVYEASNKVGENEIDGALHINPQFQNAGNGGTKDLDSLVAYQLKDDSGLINKGSYVYLDMSGAKLLGERDYYVAKKDFFGNDLYHGAPDIGVHEVQTDVNTSYKIEDNATYKIVSSIDQKYLQGDKDSLLLNEKKQDNQEFVFVNSEDGYKLKILSASANQLYLSSENNQLSLSEDNQTVWKVNDLNNGLVSISYNGKYLANKDGKAVLVDSFDNDCQWKLDYIDSSKSFNTGGDKVEGYSADQLWNESSLTPGRYGEVKVVEDNSSDGVYASGVVGKEIGYKFPIQKGSYNIKLSFNELENVKDRTFDIVVNGSVYASQYKVQSQKDLEIPDIPAKNGMIDVKLVAAYNDEGVKTDATLSGISLEKSVANDTNFLLNCGAAGIDGLSSDAPYPTNGSGYYGDSNEIDFTTDGRPSIDGGMPSAMETAREGKEFGYKFKAQPGAYRLKCLFNDGKTDTEGRVFDIYVNDELVEENFDLDKVAGSRKKAVDFTKIISSKNGLIDIQFKSKNGTNALVNAILIDKISQYEERENILLNKTATASTKENDNLSAPYAVDGNHATRWGSEFYDNQSIMVNLEDKYMLDTVYADWTPGAYATKYRIETSLDGSNWETVEYVTDAKPGLNAITFEPKEAKYLRIVGEEKNSSYGISITELEAFGTKITGESRIEATAELSEKGVDLVTLKALDIYKRYTTMNVDIEYNKDDVEYIGDENVTLNPNLYFVSKDSSQEGHLNYVFEIKNTEAFLNNPEFMNVKLKANKKRVPIKVNVTFSDAAAQLTKMNEVTVYLNNNISHDELLALVNQANEMYGKATEGYKPGQYNQAVMATFKKVIDQGQDVYKNNQADQYNEMYNQLEQAMKVFKDSVNKEKYSYYHRDYTNDKTADYQCNNGSVEVVDDKLHIKLNGKESTATATEAVHINEGIFDIKFDIDSLDDQVRFDLKNTDNSRIEVGYENGRWFWGGGIGNPTWDYFPQTANDDLFTDKTNHVTIKFTKNEDKKTVVALTVNGNYVGSITSQFNNDKGNFRFWTRTTAKNIDVHEVTYTDAPVYTITSSCSENGTIDALTTESVYAERSKTIHFTPNKGYMVSKVTVDGQEVEFDNNEYTFDYVIEDHDIHVEFSKIVINKNDLKQIINTVDQLNKDNYTSGSWTHLNSDLQKAKNVFADVNVSQSTVDEVTKSLNQSYKALVLKSADYNKIDELLTQINQLDLGKYTQDSVKALKDAMAGVERDLTILDQEKVNKMLETLQNAFDKLQIKGNKDTLQELLDVCNQIDLDDYQKEGKAEYNRIYQEALKVLKNANATQEEIDAVKDQLSEAKNALKKKEVEVNKDALQELLDVCNQIDLDVYQKEGKAEYNRVYQEAMKVLKNDKATQEEIDAVKAQLLEAKNALKKKDIVVEPGKDPDTNTDNQKPQDSDDKNVEGTQTGDHTNIAYPFAFMTMALAFIKLLKVKKEK